MKRRKRLKELKIEPAPITTGRPTVSNTANSEPDTYLDPPALKAFFEVRGVKLFARSRLYALEQSSAFPARVVISPGRVAYKRSEIEAFFRERDEARSSTRWRPRTEQVLPHERATA